MLRTCSIGQSPDNAGRAMRDGRPGKRLPQRHELGCAAETRFLNAKTPQACACGVKQHIKHSGREYDHSRRVVPATNLPSTSPLANGAQAGLRPSPPMDDVSLRWFSNTWKARIDLKLQSSLSSGVNLQGLTPAVCHTRQPTCKFAQVVAAVGLGAELRYNHACCSNCPVECSL